MKKLFLIVSSSLEQIYVTGQFLKNKDLYLVEEIIS